METTKWAIDPTHSELQFKVKHLLISTVTGHFKDFTASIETQGDDLTTAKVHLTADLSSISTNNDQRDAHLRSTDFFDAENHPQLSFVGNGLEKIDEENYKANGTLTIKGKSNPVSLKVEFGGMTTDPWGNTRIGLSVSGKINRNDYGVNFSMGNETGAILLGEDITINANTEFVKEAALQTA